MATIKNTLNRPDRNYENQTDIYNDLTNPVYKLAVFNRIDSKFYKLTVIDYRGMRYEVSGMKLSKWVHFGQGDLIDFTNDEQFDMYYKLYCDKYPSHHHTKTYIKEWLMESINRVGIIPKNEKEEK
jgi:hypothetical protein